MIKKLVIFHRNGTKAALTNVSIIAIINHVSKEGFLQLQILRSTALCMDFSDQQSAIFVLRKMTDANPYDLFILYAD